MIMREPTQRTFGDWLRQRRRALDLTQEELARQVGCSAITLRKLEAEERRPSKQIAERLAEVLNVPPGGRADFLRFARGDPFAAPAEFKSAAGVEQKPNPRHNLPLQLTSFIGREKEIAEVEQWLTATTTTSGPRAECRLVTLTGPGGTGKTRLALQAAAHLLNAFPDGVWLVELAPLADPGLIAQTVATVFALKEEASRPLLATLTEHLCGKTALLILDNCEHLIQASARFAEVLLQGCPNLSILASSREMLGVTGERSLYVSSLSTPEPRVLPPTDTLMRYEAVRLFAERAVAAAPNFSLTISNAPAVVQVCQRLDGIPLAIELAAVRLRMLPVEQIAARLDDSFRLLTGGSRTALPRHQTLQALIDWSYQLLTASEQVLLGRLAVFAGGWTLEAAEAVGAGDGIAADQVFDLLSHLIDKSLVRVAQPAGGAARYHLLETIRQYALAKLAASGEADETRGRHAAYYLALAEAAAAWTGRLQLASLDRLEMERDNLRAALGWCQSAPSRADWGLRLAAQSGRWWSYQGYWTEAQGWLEGALAHPGAANYPHGQALANVRLGLMFAYRGDYVSAQAQIAQGLRLFQELADRPNTAMALAQLGMVARDRGDAATARARLEESLALYRELRDESGICGATNTLAETMSMQGDLVAAKALLEVNLRRARQLEDPQSIAWPLNHLGHIAQLQGEYAEAIRLHEASLKPFRELGARHGGHIWAHHDLGETYLAQGDAQLAASHFAQALAVARDLGYRAGLAWCLAGMAGVAVLDEEPERATRLWGAAEALRQSIGARHAPAARATREKLIAKAREQLGDEAFDAAWAKGQAMTAEQAIELAVEAAK